MWFWKRKSNEKPKLPDRRIDEDAWITVPFRFAEAARVSIYTIGSQPDVPDGIRWWISQWLTNYNSQLVYYMRENYGPDIFPILDRITQDVIPANDNEPVQVSDESWEKWERQFREEQ